MGGTMNWKCLLLMPLLLVIASCGKKDSGDDNGGRNTLWQYEFRDLNCTTKTHSYLNEDGRKTMCSDLQDDGFNCHCALNSRKRHYRENCQDLGVFQQKVTNPHPNCFDMGGPGRI